MKSRKNKMLLNIVTRNQKYTILKSQKIDQYEKNTLLETDNPPNFNHSAGQLAKSQPKLGKACQHPNNMIFKENEKYLDRIFPFNISKIAIRYIFISIFATLVTGSQDCNPMSGTGVCKEIVAAEPTANPISIVQSPGQGQISAPVSGSPHPTNDCSLSQTGTGLVNFCPPTSMTAEQIRAQTTYPSSPYTPVQQPTDLNCTINCKKVIKSGGISPLSSLERIDPTLTKELQRILTYSGIKEPWDRIKDFFDDKQRMMPDPCMLYSQMRDILKVFESLKELISDELRKIQIYVERAKMYLKEDHVKLKDQLARMSQLLSRMKSTKDRRIQADQANNFNKVNEETQDDINEYNRLKDWLFETLTYFKKLF